MLYIREIDLVDGIDRDFLYSLKVKYNVIVLYTGYSLGSPVCTALGDYKDLARWLKSDEDGYGMTEQELFAREPGDDGIRLHEETEEIDRDFLKLLFKEDE